MIVPVSAKQMGQCVATESAVLVECVLTSETVSPTKHPHISMFHGGNRTCMCQIFTFAAFHRAKSLKLGLITPKYRLSLVFSLR